jgi:superfamily II DNA/RNA helicase
MLNTKRDLLSALYHQMTVTADTVVFCSLRRVGRTARAGRSGTCTVFAYGWQLPIARSVMGSKLDASTAFNRPNSDDEDERPFKGVKGRMMQQKNKKRYEIKSNIEGSQLWNDA